MFEAFRTSSSWQISMQHCRKNRNSRRQTCHNPILSNKNATSNALGMNSGPPRRQLITWTNSNSITFLFQLAISLLASFSTVASGMSLGFSAIALPEMLSKDSPDNLDIDQASWFGMPSRSTCEYRTRWSPHIRSFVLIACFSQRGLHSYATGVFTMRSAPWPIWTPHRSAGPQCALRAGMAHSGPHPQPSIYTRAVYGQNSHWFRYVQRGCFAYMRFSDLQEFTPESCPGSGRMRGRNSPPGFPILAGQLLRIIIL